MEQDQPPKSVPNVVGMYAGLASNVRRRRGEAEGAKVQLALPRCSNLSMKNLVSDSLNPHALRNLKECLHSSVIENIESSFCCQGL